MNSINLQGNILTYDILEKIANSQATQQAPKDYGFDSKSQIFTELENSWGIIKSQYETFNKRLAKEKEGDSGVSVTRKYWMDPFLSELGFDIQRNESGQIINDRNYFVSHQDNALNGFPIHIIGANQSVDKKYPNMRMSSHALIQEYLNHHENLYALVTNGHKLRLLRDSQLLTKVSYVEFDLQKMIEENQFSDFVLLWKLLHVTRMPNEPENGDQSILEQYHLNSLESGSRIREKLSQAVKHGITLLGNGLIQESQNEALRIWIKEAPLERPKDFYGELLRLIYRILFVMVIEERDLIYPANISEEQQKQKTIYYQYYSLQRLRKLAVKHYYGNNQHYDLWQYLMNIFRLYEGSKGQQLGIQALAGDLFANNAVAHIRKCQLNNDVLLQLFKGLTLFENEQGQSIMVNYKSLDVEEFGSVYEGLLELDPAIDPAVQRFSFVKGEGRSSSGSHYTPDELVQPLIKHSLEHLIQDIVKEKIGTEDKINKLLKLSVCDVACGSGHILLAAARRIGLEIARLRSDEEQPNPKDTRIGVRDAIRNCIYGVDKNPLAVELCKVAMWLEAHVPGEPLNFLDHKIKNGDAIVGLAKFEELETGIDDGAFKKLAGDDSDIIKRLKKNNKEGRNSYQKIKKSGHKVLEKFKISSNAYDAILEMPENTIEEIEAKKNAYAKLMKGPEYLRLRSLADLKIAQFFIPKNQENEQAICTNNDYYQIISGHQTFQNQKVIQATVASYTRNFFHWFLEFPEVFANGGFDCILGNPPFLGGQRISGYYGHNYLNWVKTYFVPANGGVDLVGYFFRRIFEVITPYGFQSLISTNTISQGDTRVGSLEEISNQGGTINHAIRSMQWPGVAAVEVAMVSIYKGNWNKKYVLDGKETQFLSTYLDNQEFIGNPFRLQQNQGKSFIGSYILGKGFILNPNEVKHLIEQNAQNKEVLFPYLNGQDLNNQIDQNPTRWVINFFDWSEEKAKEYPDCYKIILDKVKPERTRWKKDKNENIIEGEYAIRKPRRIRWWQYAERADALYRNITSLEKILVVPLVSKFSTFAFVEVNQVFMHKLAVIAFDKYFSYVIIANTLHHIWAWKYSSTLGSSTLNYSSTDVFETYPFPQNLPSNIEQKLESIGEQYHEYRKQLMLSIQLGLTKTYNQFHNKHLIDDAQKDITDLKDTDIKKDFFKESWNLYRHFQKIDDAIPLKEAVHKIQELRRLHIEMDNTVLEAYNWHIDTKRWGKAIELQHDFYEVDYLPENDRVRYTIHPDARKEVLKRLLLLNHEIHESEERGISYGELDKEKIMDIYKEEIGSWLNKVETLHPKTLKFLSSGEDLLPTLDTSTAKSYKPFVGQYSSALENELQSKIFITWNNKFQEQWKDNDEGKIAYLTEQVELAPKISMMCGNLKKNDDKYTLGNMHYFLNIIWNPKSKTVKKSKLMQDFKAHAYAIYSDEFINKEVVAELDTFIKNFRNEAAHTGEVNKTMATACMKEVRQFINLMVKSEVP